jgi:hypothetical protein
MKIKTEQTDLGLSPMAGSYEHGDGKSESSDTRKEKR